MLNSITAYRRFIKPTKRTTTTFILFVSFLTFCKAQSTISPSAGRYSNDDLSIDWTIGEVAVTTLKIDEGILITQGFNQPIVLCNPCDKECRIEFSVH